MGSGAADTGAGLLGTSTLVHVVDAPSEQAIREAYARDPWSGTHLVLESIGPWTIRLDARRG
jgi:hypothetical protein